MFSGSVLLSGGYECVLVKWALPTFKKSNTLPRLESPIVGIACSKDSAHYAVCYSDNGKSTADVFGRCQCIHWQVSMYSFTFSTFDFYSQNCFVPQPHSSGLGNFEKEMYKYPDTYIHNLC